MKKIVNLAAVLSSLIFCSVEGMEQAPAGGAGQGLAAQQPVGGGGEEHYELADAILDGSAIMIAQPSHPGHAVTYGNLSEVPQNADKNCIFEQLIAIMANDQDRGLLQEASVGGEVTFILDRDNSSFDILIRGIEGDGNIGSFQRLETGGLTLRRNL